MVPGEHCAHGVEALLHAYVQFYEQAAARLKLLIQRAEKSAAEDGKAARARPPPPVVR